MHTALLKGSKVGSYVILDVMQAAAAQINDNITAQVTWEYGFVKVDNFWLFQTLIRRVCSERKCTYHCILPCTVHQTSNYHSPLVTVEVT